MPDEKVTRKDLKAARARVADRVLQLAGALHEEAGTGSRDSFRGGCASGERPLIQRP